MQDYDTLACQMDAYKDALKLLNRVLDEGWIDACEDAGESVRDAIRAIEDKLPEIDAAMYEAEKAERRDEEREYREAVY